MELEVSTVVDRPPAVVWDFYAVHHVENHPRWDPDLELENTPGGPIRVGTVIRRRSTRFDPPTEGTIEVVEFESQKLMRVKNSGWVDDDQRLCEVCGNERQRDPNHAWGVSSPVWTIPWLTRSDP